MSDNVTKTMGGKDNYPEKLLVKNQKRGFPLTEKKGGQDGFDDYQLTTYGFDPQKHTVIYPDGTTEEIAFGKNPHHHRHHASGYSMNIFKDGTIAILQPGNHYEYTKGGATSTHDGHNDHRGGGHTRENYDGGQYGDHNDDHAVHVKGNQATHVVGNATHNVQGKTSIRSNQGLSIGTQDDDGKLAMHIHMHDGTMDIVSKGDVNVTSKTGALKFKGSNITMEAQSSMTIKSKTYNLATQTKQEGYTALKLPDVPATTYTLPEATAYHGDTDSVNTTVQYAGTLNPDGSGAA